MFQSLFSPIRVGSVEVPNRFVVPAMVMNLCAEDGSPTPRWLDYLEARAKGGWGLIITEDFAVDPAGKGYTHIPGLWSDDQISLHAELPQRVHRYRSKIFAQIYHAGRQTNRLITGLPPVAPSPIPCPTKKEMPRELTIGEIEKLIEQFGDCARRAKTAGFDGVEVHGAHGYLVAQFLSAYSNKRADRYGGSLFNRTRFAREIIADIRRKTDNRFPIVFRVSGDEFVPGGRDIEETKAVALILAESGVDAIHVSAGVYGSRHAVVPPARIAHGWISDHALEVKHVVSIPVITVGRINDPFIAESILRSGKADMVAMGRASLADADLPIKSAEGRLGQIIHCVGCMQGCVEKIRKEGSSAGCILNPTTGREQELAITPAPVKKKVLVAGGGIAGMEAAIVAAQRGHATVLYEKTDRLGGNYLLASVPPGKGEIAGFIAWQQQELSRLGVLILLNAVVTQAAIDEEQPDAVIVATGSRPLNSPFQTSSQMHTVQGLDVLAGRGEVGDRVVVVGGGMVGAETACHLAVHGKSVTIVEMLPDIATDTEVNTRFLLLEDLKRFGVAIMTRTQVQSISPDAVILETDGDITEIRPVNTVVLALGAESEAGLFEALHASVARVVNIGDSSRVRNAADAILEGYRAGLGI